MPPAVFRLPADTQGSLKSKSSLKTPFQAA